MGDLHKLYYRIGEVSKLVGVQPHVLRYWEQSLRSVRPTKSPKGHRIYTKRDVEKLLRVRELIHEHKFTLAGASKKLREQGFGPDEEPAAAEALAPAGPAAPVATDALRAVREELSFLLGELDRVEAELLRSDLGLEPTPVPPTARAAQPAGFAAPVPTARLDARAGHAGKP